MRYLLFLWCLTFTLGLGAQNYKSRIQYKVEMGDTSQLHQLILLDYTKLLGTALEVKADSLYFRLRSAATVSAIPLSELRYLGVFTVSDSSPDADGAGKRLRPSAGPPPFTDMTYERTALPLKGKGQVRVINLLYGVGEWNLSENLQIGVGLGGPLGIITTQKLRFSLTPYLNVGLTGQQLLVPPIGFDNEIIVLGDLAAIVTVGDDRRFVNLGTGYLFNTDDRDSPIAAHRFGIGGKIGRKWHLYGEFLMSMPSSRRFSDLNLFPSFTASLGQRRHRWNFGVFTVILDEDSFVPPPLPFVGYSYYW